jgi:hypothetical protein
MKLFDLESPQTEQSQKVLESYFGNSVDFAKMAPVAAQSMLTKVRSLISEHRTHTSERDPGFVKLLVMERGLTARLAMREANITLEPQTGATQIKADGDVIGSTDDQATAMQFKKDVEDGKIKLGEKKADYSAKKAAAGKDIGKPGKNFSKIAKSAAKKYGSKAAGERVAGSILNKLRNENIKLKMNGSYLTENEVQQAQVVLAAQDMVDRIQDMLEDVTAMQFKDLPALSASISSTVGTNESQAFNNAASAALASLVDAIQSSKVGMETAQGTLTGQEPVVPGAEEVATPVDPMAADPIDAVATDVDDVEVDVDVEAPAANSLGRARR